MRIALACSAAAALLLAVAGGTTATASSTTYLNFKTPSGNIGCGYAKLSGETASLRCEIVSGMKPLPPRRCPGGGDWGRAVIMSPSGRPSRICITDTVMEPSARVLAYGKTWRRAPFSCTSRATGLTCRNGSGHGWFLSRQLSRVF